MDCMSYRGSEHSSNLVVLLMSFSNSLQSEQENLICSSGPFSGERKRKPQDVLHNADGRKNPWLVLLAQ